VVTIAFRDETLTTGTPNIRTVTAATSIALASGGTLGFTAAEAGRLYVWAIDNAGTVELALSRTADIFPESNLVTTVAIGSGSDLATAMYSTTQRTSLACRCIGYIEITTCGTAGEWDNAPTKIQVMGPAIKRTGDIIQTVYTKTSSVASGGTAIPHDNSKPQITEGNLYLTQVITPTSAINILYIDSLLFAGNSNSNMWMAAALFLGAGADALATGGNYQGSAASTVPIPIKYRAIAGAVSELSFTVRCGAPTGATTTVNGGGGNEFYNGTYSSYIVITEVFA
jgi:hypothetical protein